MPYFTHFIPYDYPIIQFPGFYNALFDMFPNKNHAKLRWKNAVRKIFHRASAQLSPSHPSTSNYRFFIGFSFWMSRATPDPQKIASQKQRTVAYFCEDFSFGLSSQQKIFNKNPNQNALEYLA